jgi:Ca2+-binding RTX toxin-like protein
VLLGTPRNDELDAGGGLDLVRAGAGDDDVSGGWSKQQGSPRGDRADVVYLGPGDDSGDGGPGRDRLYGGPGSDDITGGPGGDYLDGGPGDDYLYSGLGCSDTFESSPEANEEMLTDSYRRDAEGRWTRVPPEPNEVFGRSGNDFLAGDRANDRLDGGLGFDSGTGGYYDGRIDWITSLERPDNCDSRPIR